MEIFHIIYQIQYPATQQLSYHNRWNTPEKCKSTTFECRDTNYLLYFSKQSCHGPTSFQYMCTIIQRLMHVIQEVLLQKTMKLIRSTRSFSLPSPRKKYLTMNEEAEIYLCMLCMIKLSLTLVIIGKKTVLKYYVI